MKKLFTFIRRFLGLLLVAAVLFVLYLNAFGFPPFLTRVVVHQLARAGVAAQFRHIHLDFERGIVATDAVLADARAPQQTLAQIDEVQLRLNWRRLMRKQNAIDALVIANATLSVPTPADEIGPQTFAASDAFATFLFEDDGAIQIDRLSGVYAGIQLHVAGRIVPRAAPAEAPVPKEAGAGGGGHPPVFLTKVLRELNNLRGTQPPQLDLDVNIDLGQPLAGTVKARLRGSQLTYRKLQIDSAAVDVEMRTGAVQIQQAVVKLYGGEVSIKGRYDFAGGMFDVEFLSTTDPTALAVALPPDVAKVMREVRLRANPTITARYALTPENGSLPKLAGTVETGAFDARGVRFRSVKFAFEDVGPAVTISDAVIVTPEGRLTGQGKYDFESSDFSYSFDSTVDPRKLVPLMTGVMRQVVEPSWFDTPPHIVASVSGDFVDSDAFAYDARIEAERCSYRGVGLKRASATLRLRQGKLDVQELSLVRDEGELQGNVQSDFNRRRVNFDLQTTANPSAMAPILGPKAAKIMQPYRFGPRTEANARGLICFDDADESAWVAHVSNDGFSTWKLTADRATADLVFTNNTLRIDNFSADAYAGKLRGRAEFAMKRASDTNTVEYLFDFETERCDVHRLLSDIRGRKAEASGSITGHCMLHGRGSDLSTLRGEGDLEITDGILWEAPLFGIFSRILNDIGSGLGSTKVTKAKASFRVGRQMVRTDDLQIAAGAFSVSSRGKIGFDGKLDFSVRGQLLKAVPGVNFVTWFLANVFEYRVAGTLADPSYRAANLPKELLPHD